jgi:hypothetical protein
LIFSINKLTIILDEKNNERILFKYINFKKIYSFIEENEEQFKKDPMYRKQEFVDLKINLLNIILDNFKEFYFDDLEELED